MRVFGGSRLERLTKKRDVAGLVALLRDRQVAEQAMTSLLALKDSSAADHLIGALGDSDPEMRCRAAEVLGELRDDRAVEPLLAALDDDRAVRVAAVEALGRIGDPRAIEALLGFVNGEDKRLGVVAARALGELGDSRALPELVAALGTVTQFDVDASRCAQLVESLEGLKATSALIDAMRLDNWRVRSFASMALGRMHNPEAVDALVSALSDPADSVRRDAARALGEIGDCRAVEPLINALGDYMTSERAIQALGQLRDSRAVDPLVTLFPSANQVLQERIVRALSDIGSPEAAAGLARLLQEP